MQETRFSALKELWVIKRESGKIKYSVIFQKYYKNGCKFICLLFVMQGNLRLMIKYVMFLFSSGMSLIKKIFSLTDD